MKGLSRLSSGSIRLRTAAVLTTLATLLGTLTMTQPVVHASSQPGAPTGVTGVAVPTGGGGQITVSWTAPTSNGGAAITAYAIAWNPGSGELNTGGSGTSYTVTGLTNGTSYSFSVAAWNGIGWGPWSAASANVLACTYPGAPTNVTAVPASQQANVSWTAPASNGGSPITGYSVYVYPGGQQVGSSTTSAWINGLTNGTAYTFTIIAANAAGWGAWSAYSPYVTPTADPYFSAVMNDQPGAYYRLDEPQGTVAYDSSGHGLSAAGMGAMTRGVVPGALANSSDSATTFAGGSFTVPSSPYDDPGKAFALEAWINTSNAGTQQGILEKYSATEGSYVMRIQGGHLLVMLCNNGTTCPYQVASGVAITANTWYMVDGIYDSVAQTLTVYINGGMDGQVSGVSFLSTSPDQPLRIGARGDDGSNGFQGQLDEAAVYGSALPAANIRHHYLSSGGAPAVTVTDPYATAVLNDHPGLYYRLGETGANPEVADASGGP
ncbi:MAG TPA: fibronectin type III domain-containing protein, partial [Candidatus Dormibacteraeota bacterium]|nr:fibronectin type III domain-containing protein [Candidatus Dormibacteraeota bacterium]